MRQRRPEARARRRAFTLVEITISSLVLSIAMVLTLHVLAWVAAERRAVERRECAVQEVANLMERLTARPWDELTAQRLAQVTLSQAARSALPGAELTASVDDLSKPVVSRRLTFRLRWRNRAGGFERPVRLSAWTYPRRNEP